MADQEKLDLGKGAAFVKGRLKALPECNDFWEADFRALPGPITRAETHYLGLVVTKDGSLLAGSAVHGRPSVNDLATILTHAMRRPLDDDTRRPELVRLRGHPRWRKLFPHLEEIGIGVEVSIERGLPAIEKAYLAYLRRLRDERKAGRVGPTPARSKVEATFPAIARYVGGHGDIEIGDQESFGFVVRAIGYGGMDFEDDRPETLAVLEAGLARWFEELGVDSEWPARWKTNVLPHRTSTPSRLS